MLYKLVAALAILESTDALKINGAGMSRRNAIAKAAALAPLVPLAAFADLKKAGDADIYKRADDGKLNAARAIERAKAGDLADGSSATCSELDALIAVDREAIEFEKEKVEALGGSDASKKVAEVEAKLQGQVDKLKKIRLDKGCSTAGANLKKGTDFDVYKRADEGTLTSARVIERAKKGQLVDGSGASCAELEKIIAATDPAVKKAVAEAEAAISSQVKKLEALKA